MAIVNTLKIYEVLKEKVPEEQAKVITKVIENSFEEYRENQKEFLVTKEDTTKNVGGLELKIEQLRAELKQDNAKLENKISETKAEIIKWMFIFWIGQFAAIVGTLTAILFAFFKR